MDLFPHQKKAIELLKNQATEDGHLVIQVAVKPRGVFGSQVPFPMSLKKTMINKPRSEVSGELKLAVEFNKQVLLDETDKK
jgi:hypothetical protein